MVLKQVKFKGSCLRQDKITCDHEKVVNIYIVYETNKSINISDYPKPENFLFGAVSSTKNSEIDNYKYSRYGIGLDRYGFFSHPSGGTGRNVIIFIADMSSFIKIDNRKKYIIILGKGPTQGLEHIMAAEKMYSINFMENHKNFGPALIIMKQRVIYLFVNGTEIHKFKAKDSKVVAITLCLANISNDWSVENMKKTGLNGCVYDFSVDYDAIAVDDTLDICKYLMKRNDIVENVSNY